MTSNRARDTSDNEMDEHASTKQAHQHDVIFLTVSNTTPTDVFVFRHRKSFQEKANGKKRSYRRATRLREWNTKPCRAIGLSESCDEGIYLQRRTLIVALHAARGY